MLIEWISELIDNINHHGVRWGLVFAFYAIYRKERRNYRLDKRDIVHNAYFAAILANQRLILKEMGREAECADISNLIKSPLAHRGEGGFIFSWVEKYSARSVKWFMNYNMRRKKKMNTQNINWATLVPCLLGAVKLILQPMGINIPDQNLNEIANGIAALATVIGIIYSHRKVVTSNANTQHFTGDGPAV